MCLYITCHQRRGSSITGLWERGSFTRSEEKWGPLVKPSGNIHPICSGGGERRAHGTPNGETTHANTTLKHINEVPCLIKIQTPLIWFIRFFLTSLHPPPRLFYFGISHPLPLPGCLQTADTGFCILHVGIFLV